MPDTASGGARPKAMVGGHGAQQLSKSSTFFFFESGRSGVIDCGSPPVFVRNSRGVRLFQTGRSCSNLKYLECMARPSDFLEMPDKRVNSAIQ